MQQETLHVQNQELKGTGGLRVLGGGGGVWGRGRGVLGREGGGGEAYRGA